MIGEDCNGMFFMAGPAAVCRNNNPVIPRFSGDYIISSFIDHRLNSKYHACLNPRIRAAAGAVGDRRILMHIKPNTMPAVIINDPIAVLLVGNLVDSP